jgi:LPXTG-motif cell wall-anchored protein
MSNWLDFILTVGGMGGLDGGQDWLGLLSPRSQQRLAVVAAALAALAGCGLASALMGSVWPLALAGLALGLLAGAAWYIRRRRNKAG